MQLYSGDVIICRQARQSRCSYGLVRRDNAMPTQWMTSTLSAARIWALKHTVETGGMRREFQEVSRPGAVRRRSATRKHSRR